jgi:hypothetical protein
VNGSSSAPPGVQGLHCFRFFPSSSDGGVVSSIHKQPIGHQLVDQSVCTAFVGYYTRSLAIFSLRQQRTIIAHRIISIYPIEVEEFVYYRSLVAKKVTTYHEPHFPPATNNNNNEDDLHYH